jgi:hypothetical protein
MRRSPSPGAANATRSISDSNPGARRGRWASSEITDKEFFRVLARPSGVSSSGDVDADGFLITVGAVFDVYRDRIRNEWRLARIWD